MRRTFTSAAIAGLLVSATPSYANCGPLMDKLGTWLGTDDTLVRMVTTFTKTDNKVTYTRGYLDFDDSRPGALVAPSRRYFNESASSTSRLFAEEDTDVVTIELLPPDPSGSLQLNYLIDADPSAGVGYTALCRGDMMYVLPSDGGVLAVSFKRSQI